MRAVLQRVRRGRVSIEGETIAEIDRGLVILIGIGHEDSAEDARRLAEKCAALRIFEDDAGKTNLSVQDIEGQAIVISQFTLYADTRKGRRPSFTKAARPETTGPGRARRRFAAGGWVPFSATDQPPFPSRTTRRASSNQSAGITVPLSRG